MSLVDPEYIKNLQKGLGVKTPVTPEQMGSASNASHNANLPRQKGPEERATDLAGEYGRAQTRDMEDARLRALGLFGPGNASMKEIMDTRRQRALGLNGDEVRMMRERGTAGINSSMATGLRQLRGMQSVSGVRGGAATAQAIPIVQNAMGQRAGLEREIAEADMLRRGQELSAYETTLTGERAGGLGYEFGMAGLGSTNRSNASQHVINSDYIRYLMGLTGGGAGGATPADRAWNNAPGTTGRPTIPGTLSVSTAPEPLTYLPTTLPSIPGQVYDDEPIRPYISR